MAPESLLVPQLLDSTQPAREVRRGPAIARFYTYLHEYTPLSSGGANVVRTFTVDGGVLRFDVYKVARLADSLAAKVQVFTTPNREPIWNEPLFLAHLGDGKNPTVLPKVWELGRNNVITAVVTDRQLVAADNNIRLAYFGAKVGGPPKRIARRYTKAIPWTYQANFTAYDSGTGALAASETRLFTVTTDADSDFEVWKITVVSDDAITVQVWSDGEEWFSSPIRSELLGGSVIESATMPLDSASGSYPCILPVPRIIGPAEWIRVQVANQVALSNRADVQFHGLRMFPGGGLRA